MTHTQEKNETINHRRNIQAHTHTDLFPVETAVFVGGWIIVLYFPGIYTSISVIRKTNKGRSNKSLISKLKAILPIYSLA